MAILTENEKACRGAKNGVCAIGGCNCAMGVRVIYAKKSLRKKLLTPIARTPLLLVLLLHGKLGSAVYFHAAKITLPQNFSTTPIFPLLSFTTFSTNLPICMYSACDQIKHRHRLDMRSMREHVDHSGHLQYIATFIHQNARIACKG